jgi:hypothetical protein
MEVTILGKLHVHLTTSRNAMKIVKHWFSAFALMS